jgi:phosphoenolpyruvate carboxylase
MAEKDSTAAFEVSIKNRFNVYNSLFLNLPFRKVSNIGMLIPLLQHHCKAGLDKGMEPVDILDSFFALHPEIKTGQEMMDFYSGSFNTLNGRLCFSTAWRMPASMSC